MAFISFASAGSEGAAPQGESWLRLNASDTTPTATTIKMTFRILYRSFMDLLRTRRRLLTQSRECAAAGEAAHSSGFLVSIPKSNANQPKDHQRQDRQHRHKKHGRSAHRGGKELLLSEEE